jgi:integrase
MGPSGSFHPDRQEQARPRQRRIASSLHGRKIGMARKAAAPKPARRKPGTGAIRLKPGREKPFEACYPIPGHPPRYEAFRSHEDAAAWLDSLVEENKKKTRDIAGGSMLVQDYLPIWLELHRPHIGPKTAESYQYYCEYACGEGKLGRYRLDEVDALIAQRMVNRIAASGFKNTAHLKAVLFQAFEYAFDPLEYIRKNPFTKVKTPPIEHKDGIALTKAERARMLEVAAQDDETPTWRTDAPDGTTPARKRGRKFGQPAPLLPFWHLTSRLAFRRGEASSLKWANVDLENGVVTITTTRGRLGKEHIEGKTKTKKPRSAPLPDDMVELFRAHRTAQMRAALAHGWRWSEQGYVFADDRTGLPLSVDHIYYRWKRIRTAAQLDPKMTVHDGRVTALTILALDGVPASVRKLLSGHSTARMDEHYTSHAALEDVRRALG